MSSLSNGQPMNNMNNQNNTIQCNNNGFDEYGNPCTPQKSWSSYLNPMNWNWIYGTGGRRRRRTVRRGGGFRAYTDQNVASTASRFSGGRTAQPHQWNGGKRRRRTKKGKNKRRSFRCNKCSKRKRHRH